MSKSRSTLSMVDCWIEVMKFVFVIGLPASTGRVRQPSINERAAHTATLTVTPETTFRNITHPPLEPRPSRPMPLRASFRRPAVRPRARRGQGFSMGAAAFSRARPDLATSMPRVENTFRAISSRSAARQANVRQRRWRLRQRDWRPIQDAAGRGKVGPLSTPRGSGGRGGRPPRGCPMTFARSRRGAAYAPRRRP